MSHSIAARCPSCQQHARFTFNGNQQWPPEVARKLGLPAVIGLWTCAACHSTISENALRPARQELHIQPASLSSPRLAPCRRAARRQDQPGL